MRISAPLGSRAHHLQSRVVRLQRSAYPAPQRSWWLVLGLAGTLTLLTLPVIVYALAGI